MKNKIIFTLFLGLATLLTTVACQKEQIKPNATNNVLDDGIKALSDPTLPYGANLRDPGFDENTGSIITTGLADSLIDNTANFGHDWELEFLLSGTAYDVLMDTSAAKGVGFIMCQGEDEVGAMAFMAVDKDGYVIEETVYISYGGTATSTTFANAEALADTFRVNQTEYVQGYAMGSVVLDVLMDQQGADQLKVILGQDETNGDRMKPVWIAIDGNEDEIDAKIADESVAYPRRTPPYTPLGGQAGTLMDGIQDIINSLPQ